MKEFETSTAFSNNKETHSHIHSIEPRSESLEWKPISTEEELHLAATTGGSYYLAKDIDLSRGLEITKDMNLALNDKVLKQTDHESEVIYVKPNVIFNLHDCSRGTIRYWDKDAENSLWTLKKDDSTGKYVTVGGVITGGDSDFGGVFNEGTFIMYNGNITGNSAKRYGGGVMNNGKFTMNGGSITGNRAHEGGGVFNDKNSPFMMHGGEITGNHASRYGGGVLNSFHATFTMHGGSIFGNSADEEGGGVDNGGVFAMHDGNITGNNARDGGGVHNRGEFTMCGGIIAGNSSARVGGGVYNYALFTMNGGEIIDNTAEKGGGVRNNAKTTFKMNVGNITGNEAKCFGGGVENYGDFIINGGRITGNKLTNGTTNNVYLWENAVLTIGETLSEGARFGITAMNTKPYTFTNSKVSKSVEESFFSDNPYECYVTYDAYGRLSLVPSPAHTCSGDNTQ